MNRFKFIAVLPLLLVLRLGAQQPSLSTLNSFMYVVVKPANNHLAYVPAIKAAIEARLKQSGFLRILDGSALVTSEYKPCDIVTCEFNFSNTSGSSLEIITELSFFDCNYTKVFFSRDRARYSFITEKNVLKQFHKHLGLFDGFTYAYVPKPEPAVKSVPEEPTVQEPAAVAKSGADSSVQAGKYYALLIGVSNYADPDIPDLDNLPVKDAERLAAVLSTHYTFNNEDISILRNPTRRDMVIALDNISKLAGPNDNVLIFYAGHGHYEEDNEIGYWLPSDAEVANTSNWLYNDQLVASMKKIKSRHTLLVSDACFSGSIFKSRSISLHGAGEALKKKYELPSRKAITSGTLKTVPNVSVFMKYVVDRLTFNAEPFFSASQLFQSIEIPVGNNSPTTPQYGVIQNVGDEGGDFIFIRR
jgi:hypothetical protein